MREGRGSPTRIVAIFGGGSPTSLAAWMSFSVILSAHRSSHSRWGRNRLWEDLASVDFDCGWPLMCRTG